MGRICFNELLNRIALIMNLLTGLVQAATLCVGTIDASMSIIQTIMQKKFTLHKVMNALKSRSPKIYRLSCL